MRHDSPTGTALPRPTPGEPRVPEVPEASRFTLANGLRVVSVHRPTLPQLSARIIVPAGAVADPRDAPGAASMVGSLLLEGTDELTGIQINERIDAMGGAVDARVGHDFAQIGLGLLVETLDEGLELAASVLAGASFPEHEVERIRAEVLDALDARADEPANVADDEVSLAVFGESHPYGRLPIGTHEGVRRLTRDQLLELHRLRYRPEGSVLVIAGDLGGGDLRARLERAFARWQGTAAPVTYPEPPTGPGVAAGLQLFEREDAAQSEIRFAGLGIPRSSPEWVAASVANYLLGGSTITGRLGANLREDKGWTYGVRSGFSAGVHPGGWVVDTAVGAEVTQGAVEEIERELQRMIEEPVEAAELERAQEALILSLPRAFETPGRIVSRFVTLEAYGLEMDYWERFPERVRNVTAEDVLAVARTCFDPRHLARVVVGPALEVTG